MNESIGWALCITEIHLSIKHSRESKSMYYANSGQLQLYDPDIQVLSIVVHGPRDHDLNSSPRA